MNHNPTAPIVTGQRWREFTTKTIWTVVEVGVLVRLVLLRAPKMDDVLVTADDLRTRFKHIAPKSQA